MRMKELKIPIATERKWYRCPKCGQKILIYDDAAECHGVYVRCKACGDEIEVKI